MPRDGCDHESCDYEVGGRWTCEYEPVSREPMSHGQERSRGQEKPGRMSRQNDLRTDVQLAAHTVQGSLDKLGDEPTQIGWAEWKRLHMELRSDLDLVRRALEGVAGRMR